jgi:succinate dehydrogenase / fumarate reductase membrane anchor subunit
MVKSVMGVSRQGLRDWVIQRVSAVVMAVYSVGLIGYFLIHPQFDFLDWHALFAQTWIKVSTLLFVLALLFHAWVGMWTIFTDYVKPFVLRLICHLFVFFALVSCFFWALQILWGVN